MLMNLQTNLKKFALKYNFYGFCKPRKLIMHIHLNNKFGYIEPSIQLLLTAITKMRAKFDGKIM